MAALRVERVGRGLKLGVRHDELVPGGLLPAPQGVPLGGVGEADEDAVEGGGLRVVGAWLVPRLRAPYNVWTGSPGSPGSRPWRTRTTWGSMSRTAFWLGPDSKDDRIVYCSITHYLYSNVTSWLINLNHH